MWDSVLLAHSDRRRVAPPEYRRLVCRSNGDGVQPGVERPDEAVLAQVNGDGFSAR
jgi:hypothetical protein